MYMHMYTLCRCGFLQHVCDSTGRHVKVTLELGCSGITVFGVLLPINMQMTGRLRDLPVMHYFLQEVCHSRLADTVVKLLLSLLVFQYRPVCSCCCLVVAVLD